ncbi:hypothetical protein RDWZM_000853 [Blomia tropicalis]|uniref:Phosphatidylcholine transfer protein n=1 Tax=Blomia tropicalis TaxID=40697 RepID=A0A9Q0RNE2_BLOTA|nr:StAR- lipid transfer protein 7, mitochondrial [Blomia tropicalis]KAJ6222308.1 hypothetical protein RDWZM_000853 [Blomia tropicalis]
MPFLKRTIYDLVIPHVRQNVINTNQFHQYTLRGRTQFGLFRNPLLNDSKYYQVLRSSANIKERIYDKLILFTCMLHKQSNVYLCLRIRRLIQISNLYRRLYSPHDFHYLIIDHVLDRLRRIGLLIQRRSSWWKLFSKWFSRRRMLLSFTGFGLFSWEENRITDQELQELMKEFLLIENSQGSSNEKDNEDQSETYGNMEESIIDQNGEGSFLVVNCMHSTSNNNEITSGPWEVVISQENFNVWRKSVNNTSLYEYKVFGTYFDISAHSFYSVQRDLEYRKEWDKLVLKLEIIDSEFEDNSKLMNSNIDDSGNELVHWIMKYPYPMKSREYIYIRRTKIDHDRKFIVCISRSVDYPNIPENDEHVRVYDYTSQMVIRPHHDNFYKYGFDYMLTYFDDPRASFPSPAYNWMASRGVPDFVEKLHQAALRLSRRKNDIVDNVDSTEPDLFMEKGQDVNNEKSENSQDTSSENENKRQILDSVKPQQTVELPKSQASLNVASSERNRNSKSSNSNSNANKFSFKSLNIWN